MSEMTPTIKEIIQRRFGSRHDLPCNNPNVLTCAMWECQKAGSCQNGRPIGTGTQTTSIARWAVAEPPHEAP